MTRRSMQILQGTLDTMILRVLEGAPNHGYGVALAIRERAEEQLEIEDGALYTALHRLHAKKMLSAEWGVSETGRKAKFYSLTERGTKELARRQAELTDYVTAVFKVLGKPLRSS